MDGTVQMGTYRALLFAAFAAAAVCGWGCAEQPNRPPVQTTVTYGTVTAVRLVTTENRGAQAGGAMVGGSIGLIAARNQSGSTQALAGVGGALAGQQVGRVASRRQAFEYTILLGGTTTVTMLTDEGGFRIGDCVAVERGTFNNMRLADDSRCAQNAPAPAEAVRASDACIGAKDTLLQAASDEEFDRAERRVRLLCGH
jgi:outer membrane lipoprotein SlyB